MGIPFYSKHQNKHTNVFQEDGHTEGCEEVEEMKCLVKDDFTLVRPQHPIKFTERDWQNHNLSIEMKQEPTHLRNLAQDTNYNRVKE